MRTPRLRLLSALLSVAMLFTFLPTAAFAAAPTPESDFEYTISDNSVTITGYNGTDPDVIIPDRIEGHPVTVIFARAFSNAAITCVQIPSTVTGIGPFAFSDCTSLTSVEFGESAALESIATNAFNGCSKLSTIRIPASVNHIGFQAFDSSLKEILYDGTTNWSSIKNYGYTFASRVKYRRTITFETNTTDKIDTQSVYDSYPVTKPSPDPEQAGFVFVAWYTKDSQKEYDFSTPVTRDLDLYAKWQPADCTVTFDLNGHPNAKNPPAPQTVKHGQPVTEPSPAPEEHGYTFGGWYKKQTCPDDSKFDFTTPITDHITLYAKWEINKYTVTFDFNTGKASTPKTEEVEYGNPVSEPTKPTNTGYTFGGWYTDQACTDGKEFTFDADGKSTAPITDHITLYAKWTKNRYTVTFDVDGQTDLIPSVSVEHGNGVSKPTNPTKEGYTFDGWYTDAAYTNKYALWGDSITRNTTFYARWNVNPYELTIHDTDTDATTKSYDYGTTIKLDIPQRDGYTFDGWTAEGIDVPQLNQNLQYEFTMPASNVTLTAKWLKDAYTVTFNGMEHELDIVRINVKRNTPVAKPADPVDKGYTFHGWYTDKDCTTAFDFDTPITADTTLYAKWTKNAEPVKPSDPDKPSEPGKPSKPDTPNTPDTPSNPDKPSNPETKTYSVLVFDGEAELDGETVTKAEAGKTITVRLMADIVPAGQTFDHWDVLPETLELKDAQSTETTFVMPEEAVTLRAVYRDISSAPQSVNPASAALGAAVVGTGVVIAGWTAYNIGLELYAKWVLPAGAEMPNTRGELAVLLWQTAGSPEPAPLTEGMSELEKAERWVVDNGLMAESKNSSFAPEEKVSKLEVFLTLKKAKALKQ